MVMTSNGELGFRNDIVTEQDDLDIGRVVTIAVASDPEFEAMCANAAETPFGPAIS